MANYSLFLARMTWYVPRLYIKMLFTFWHKNKAFMWLCFADLSNLWRQGKKILQKVDSFHYCHYNVILESQSLQEFSYCLKKCKQKIYLYRKKSQVIQSHYFHTGWFFKILPCSVIYDGTSTSYLIRKIF